MRKLTISALLICLPGILVADIYRWVDSRGVVNYTQQKPNDVSSTLVGRASQGQRRDPSAPVAAPAATASTQQGQAELSTEQQAKLDELKNQEAQRAAELAERQQANCEKAQTTLEQLTTSTRIRVRGEDGEVRAIPEEERLSRIDQTQMAIAQNCL